MGREPPSNEITLIVGAGPGPGPCAVPGPPSSLAASVSGLTVTLGWSAPSAGGSPASYVIEIGSSPGAANLANVDTGSIATSYTASGLETGTYYVRVRAKNACGAGGPSNEIAVAVTGTAIIEASAVIGPGGGSVEVTNVSSPLFGTKVAIPAGALAQATTITISAVSSPPALPHDLERRGPLAEFGPSGLRLRVPLKITIPATSSAGPDDADLIYEFSGRFGLAPNLEDEAENHGQTLDSTTGRLTYSTAHFSGRQRLGSKTVATAVKQARLNHKNPNHTDLADGTIPFSRLNDLLEPRCNCLTRPADSETIRTIIVHSTHSQPWSTFVGEILYATNAPLFAHLYIDKDGTVVRIAPDNVIAPHTGGTDKNGVRPNNYSIGIELFVPKRFPRGTSTAVRPTMTTRKLR